MELSDATSCFHEYYRYFHNLEILDFGIIENLTSDDLLKVCDANPGIRDMTLYRLIDCPVLMAHPVMQQLETLTLNNYHIVFDLKDEYLKYFQTCQLSSFKIKLYNLEFIESALQAPKMVSMQLGVTLCCENPFTNRNVCLMSHIISLSLIFYYDNRSVYEILCAAISNLPLLQRIESNAKISIDDPAFVKILSNAEKLDFFCMPDISFSDEVLMSLTAITPRMMAWGCCLDGHSEIIKTNFCQSFRNLLYYTYSCGNDCDNFSDYHSILDNIICRNTVKTRMRAGLKHLAARSYARRHATIPQLVPEQVQDLIKFYFEKVDFDDLWNWLYLRQAL